MQRDAFYFIYLLTYLFTLNPAHCPPPSYPLLYSFHHHPPFLFWTGEGSPGYLRTLAYQVSVRLGTSSLTEARQGSPSRRTFPTKGNSFWASPHSICSGPTRRQSCTSTTYVLGDLGPAPACSSVFGSVSKSPQGPRLSWLCWSFCGVPISLEGPQSFPHLFHESPQAPSSVCGSLYPSQSAVGWSISEDSFARLLAVSIRVSLVVSGIGACSWDGSLVGPLIAWPLSQYLLCLLFLHVL